MKSKTIFITGVNGFIGQELANRLIAEGHYVHGLYETAKQKNKKVVAHWGDIRNYENLEATIKSVRPNIIIHLAARTEVEKSFYDPIDFQSVNYNGTVNLIEIAKDISELELFVFSSTMETYGAVPEKDWKPFTEETKQYPNAPYAVAKRACELYLEYAHRAYDFPFVAFRQTNAYGRHDNDFFVVEQFITQMLKNPKEANFGYAEPYRNFLYIDDLIDLYVEAINNADKVKGEFFCTGPDNAIRIRELAVLIAEKLDWEGIINWNKKPKRVGEIFYLNSTPEKAERIFNWKPKVSLSEGLDKTINIWKEKFNAKQGS